ncbi:hypothetical protein ACJJIF_13820 [Microbulbifer sp. SSSA002]|uniref:hypothetical protein n=1 Tax=Microbulbifer sp. SSSA002 TaxID=3243376 RepID=UPI00403A594F
MKMRGVPINILCIIASLHHCGIERYYNSVKAYILEKKIDCNLVGFSAGATVAWMLACSEDLGFIKKAACFYGSRVRYFLDREPGCDVDFIPAKEALFDISKITSQLAKFSMVTLHKNQFSHGFMNRCSENFHPDAYRQYSEWLQEWCTSELNAGAAKLPSPVNRVLR